MGAGAINPFFNVRQSRPMSHFVDQSIPADLMLKAGLAKQAQQDKMMQLVNTVGAYDQQALKGGDTQYVEQTKKSINEFVDNNFNKDLTTTQAQADIYKFARGIQQDKKLKQIAANLAAVQKFEADVEKLQQEGNQAFGPVVRESRRLYQNYINSGKQGEEIGLLSVQKALNLHKKEEEYFNNLKANGNQWFSDDIKVLKENGLYGKQGWKGVSKSRIGQAMRNAVPDYINTPEGQQALAIYREEKANGTLPPGINSATDYIADRLLRTGMEFMYGESTVSYEKGLNEALKKKKEEATPTPPIYDPGANFGLGETDPNKLKNTIDDPNATPMQKQIAQAQLDQIENAVANSQKGLAITETLKSLFDPNSEDHLPQPTSDEFLTEAFQSKNLNVTSKFSPSLRGEQDPETFKAVMEPAFKVLATKLPEILQQEIMDNKNLDLATAVRNSSVMQPMLDEEGKVSGIQIAGTDKQFTWEDLGVSQSAVDALPEEAGIQSKVITNMLRSAGDIYSENVFFSDASNRVENAIEDWHNLRTEMGEGTEVKPQYTFRPFEEKENNKMKSILSNANPNNFTAVNQNNERVSDAVLKDLIANVGDANISVRPSASGRVLEITRKIPTDDNKNNQETFIIEEKGNKTGTFNALFGFSGDQGLGADLGASDALEKNVGNTPVSLSAAVGQFTEALPANMDKNLTVKRDATGKGMYNLGDNNGIYTYQDILDIFSTTYNAYTAQNSNISEEDRQALESALVTNYQNIYVNSLVKAGFTPDDALVVFQAATQPNSNAIIDQDTWTLVGEALNSNYAASSFQELIQAVEYISSIQ